MRNVDRPPSLCLSGLQHLSFALSTLSFALPPLHTFSPCQFRERRYQLIRMIIKIQ
jgi:hypothetical protein